MILAATVAVLAPALMGALQPENDSQRENSAAQQVEEQADRAAPAPVLQGGIQAPQADRGCAKGQDDRSSDLCAQWKAADAAYDSAVWTARSFQLGIVGTAIGFCTLLAAIAAAAFAGKAARHARDAADAAASTAEAGEITLRPYIEVIEIRRTAPTAKFQQGVIDILVEVEIVNHGSTPAYDVDWKSSPELGIDDVEQVCGFGVRPVARFNFHISTLPAKTKLVVPSVITTADRPFDPTPQKPRGTVSSGAVYIWDMAATLTFEDEFTRLTADQAPRQMIGPVVGPLAFGIKPELKNRQAA